MADYSDFTQPPPTSSLDSSSSTLPLPSAPSAIHYPIYRLYRGEHQSIFREPVENMLIAVKEFCSKYNPPPKRNPSLTDLGYLQEHFDKGKGEGAEWEKEKEKEKKKYKIIREYHYYPCFQNPYTFFPNTYSSSTSSAPVIINNHYNSPTMRKYSTSLEENRNKNKKEEENTNKKEEDTDNKEEKKEENSLGKFMIATFASLGVLVTLSYYTTPDVVKYLDSRDVLQSIAECEMYLDLLSNGDPTLKMESGYLDIRATIKDAKTYLARRLRHTKINGWTKIGSAASGLAILFATLYGGGGDFFSSWKAATLGTSLVASAVGYVVNHRYDADRYGCDNAFAERLSLNVESMLKQKSIL